MKWIYIFKLLVASRRLVSLYPTALVAIMPLDSSATEHKQVAKSNVGYCYWYLDIIIYIGSTHRARYCLWNSSEETETIVG